MNSRAYECACSGSVAWISTVQYLLPDLTKGWRAAHDAISTTAFFGYATVLQYILGIYQFSTLILNSNLIIACSWDQSDIVSVLIGAGAEIDVEDGRPLAVAANYGESCVPILVRAGADLNKRGSAAILYACERGKSNVVRSMLLETRTPARLSSKIVVVAISTALTYGNICIAELLLEHYPTVRVNRFCPFFIEQVRAGNMPVVRSLLSHGMTAGLKLAIKIAKESNNEELVDILNHIIHHK